MKWEEINQLSNYFQVFNPTQNDSRQTQIKKNKKTYVQNNKTVY